MEAGNLVAEDWVRHADRTACWMSVGKLLFGPPERVPLTVRLHAFAIRGVAFLREQAVQAVSAANRSLNCYSAGLLNRSGFIAFLCVTTAVGIEFLPERPLPISVPWVLAGFAAGVALILRHRLFHGFAACLSALTLPLLAHWTIVAVNNYMDPNHLETALPPVGEMYSNMPRKAPEISKGRSRARSGVPALGLPQPAYAQESQNRKD